MANVYRQPDVTTARPKALAPLATRLEVTADGPSERWLVVRLPSGDTVTAGRGREGRRSPRAAAARVAGGSRRHRPPLPRRPLPLGRDERPRDRLLGPREPGLPRERGRSSARCRSAVRRLERRSGGGPGSRHPAISSSETRTQKNITHVGLYAGDGRFIDATTYETPVVREDRLDDPHWSSIYQGARRPR